MLHTLETDIIRLAYLIRLREREEKTNREGKTHDEDKLRSINRAVYILENRIASTVAAQMDIDHLDEVKMLFDGM